MIFSTRFVLLEFFANNIVAIRKDLLWVVTQILIFLRIWRSFAWSWLLSRSKWEKIHQHCSTFSLYHRKLVRLLSFPKIVAMLNHPTRVRTCALRSGAWEPRTWNILFLFLGECPFFLRAMRICNQQSYFDQQRSLKQQCGGFQAIKWKFFQRIM